LLQAQRPLKHPQSDSNNILFVKLKSVANIPCLNKKAELLQRRHAMRPIYGCPEKFREFSLCTRLLFPKFV